MSQKLFNILQDLGVTALETDMEEIRRAVLEETEVFAVDYKIPFDSKNLGYFFDKEAAHTFIKQEIESFGGKWELMQTGLPHYSSNKGEELFVSKIPVK